MHTFPHLLNGPINEQALLEMSGKLIEEGLPDDASPRQAKTFHILQTRHNALQSIVNAYQSVDRSMFACLMVGRYYAHLERAVGTYRTVQIITRSA